MNISNGMREYISKSTGTRFRYRHCDKELREWDTTLRLWCRSTTSVDSFLWLVENKCLKKVRFNDWKRPYRRDIREHIIPYFNKLDKKFFPEPEDVKNYFIIRESFLKQYEIFKEEVGKYLNKEENFHTLVLFDRMIQMIDDDTVTRCLVHGFVYGFSYPEELENYVNLSKNSAMKINLLRELRK